MLKTLRELSVYTKPHRKLFIVGSIFTLVFALLAIVDPYVTGMIIDAIKDPETNQANRQFVIIGSLIIIGVTMFRTFFRYWLFIFFEKFSQKVIYQIRRDLYVKLQSLDFNYFDRTPNGRIMSKMTGDIEAIRHFFAWITHVSIFHGTVFVLAIITMFTINPLLASTMILIIPFILYLSLKMSRSVKPTFVNIREQFSRLNTVVQENISGNRVVKAFAREPYEIEKFQKENVAFMNRNLESAKVWETYLPALDAFAVLFNVVVLFVGSIFILSDSIDMTIGELVAFNRLLWMINNPLRMVGWLINGAQNFVASYEKVKEIFDAKSQIELHEQPVVKEEIRGHIKFDDVSFHYEDLPVLDHISFEVSPGQTVALLGSTGSGKTTLTSLISRFYDASEGNIYVDHVPIKEYDVQALRNNISVAMQDIFLFSDTIEGNISYGVPTAKKQDVRYAAEIAGVNEFIYQFDENFDTVVGERGVGLSGGQKQRIALARALIQNPSILVLDDTTSAVDMETEYKILSELKKINAARTTFIIAHRISSVKDADIILVMDKGTIIERGTHQELLDQGGYYYEVFTQQMGEFDSKIKEGA